MVKDENRRFRDQLNGSSVSTHRLFNTRMSPVILVAYLLSLVVVANVYSVQIWTSAEAANCFHRNSANFTTFVIQDSTAIRCMPSTVHA